MEDARSMSKTLLEAKVDAEVFGAIKAALGKLSAVSDKLPEKAKKAVETLASILGGKVEAKESEKAEEKADEEEVKCTGKEDCPCPECKKKRGEEVEEACKGKKPGEADEESGECTGEEDCECPECKKNKAKAKEALRPSEIVKSLDLLYEAEKESGDKLPKDVITAIKALMTKLADVLKDLGYSYSDGGSGKGFYHNDKDSKHKGKKPPAYYYSSSYGDATQTVREPVPHDRKRIQASARLIESVSGTEGKKWHAVLIQSGLSKNRFMYRDDVLEKATPLFEGCKSYVDHPNTTDRKQLPERSVADIAGWFEGAMKQPDGIHATFHVAGGKEWLREMFIDAYEHNKPDLLGFSIYAEGKTRVDRQDGKLIWMVESIDKVDSVDVVTQPAAGGRIAGLIESEDGEREMKELENMTVEELSKIRPDLVESIKKTAQPQPPPKNDEGDKVIARMAEAEKAINVKLCGVALKEKLAGSKLPVAFKEAIEKDFAGRVYPEAELDARITRDTDIWAKASPPPQPVTSRVREMHENKDNISKALDAMIQNKTDVDGVKPFRSLTEAYATFKGVPIVDVNPLNILRESAAGYDSGARTLRESVTTSSWGEILGDSVTRALLAEYNIPGLDDWRKVVSTITSLKDFRTQRRQRLGGYGTLPSVGQGATYQSLTSPTDEEVTYSPSKYGGLEDLTIETIANDDLGAVQSIPRRLARAAKITLYRFVFDFLANNSSIYDALALAHSTHGNISTTALSYAQVISAVQKMRDFTAYGATTEFLQIRPKLLVVPNELEATAFYINTMDTYPDTVTPAAGGTAAVDLRRNMVKGWFEVIVVDYWTDADNWWLVADPKLAPTFELGFLNGKQEPELLSQNDPTQGSLFSADKVSYKIRHIYGGAVLDWRSYFGGIV